MTWQSTAPQSARRLKRWSTTGLKAFFISHSSIRCGALGRPGAWKRPAAILQRDPSRRELSVPRHGTDARRSPPPASDPSRSLPNLEAIELNDLTRDMMLPGAGNGPESNHMTFLFGGKQRHRVLSQGESEGTDMHHSRLCAVLIDCRTSD